MSSEVLRQPKPVAVDSLRDLVGNTPLVRLQRTGSPDGPPIYVKLENLNPSGSIRDRYIQEIIERALLAGQLQPGDTVALAGIDDSAVSAAFVASVLDLEVRIWAPRGSSHRLVPLIGRWGATIEWTDDDGGLDEAIRQAADWARPEPDRLYVDGYRRAAVKESYRAMAHEILDALEGEPLGAFVTSVTTGGTFRAVSAELQQANPMLQVGGIHILENEFAAPELPGQVEEITLDETWELRSRIARDEGLLLGPKGAACVKLATELQSELLPDQAIVALNPDAGHRYLGWEDKTLFKATQFGAS
jgi:cysteine synthase A